MNLHPEFKQLAFLPWHTFLVALLPFLHFHEYLLRGGGITLIINIHAIDAFEDLTPFLREIQGHL